MQTVFPFATGVWGLDPNQSRIELVQIQALETLTCILSNARTALQATMSHNLYLLRNVLTAKVLVSPSIKLDVSVSIVTLIFQNTQITHRSTLHLNIVISYDSYQGDRDERFLVNRHWSNAHRGKPNESISGFLFTFPNLCSDILHRNRHYGWLTIRIDEGTSPDTSKSVSIRGRKGSPDLRLPGQCPQLSRECLDMCRTFERPTRTMNRGLGNSTDTYIDQHPVSIEFWKYGIEESYSFVRDRACSRTDLLQNYRGKEAIELHERMTIYICVHMLL
ncbi:hypothetical protein BASA60_005183 [Batrachochytrium salamandrivorans]|nr:hypothetical protein BASA60_005183 [Batrachochytrium salamandrivorans]